MLLDMLGLLYSMNMGLWSILCCLYKFWNKKLLALYNHLRYKYKCYACVSDGNTILFWKHRHIINLKYFESNFTKFSFGHWSGSNLTHMSKFLTFFFPGLVLPLLTNSEHATVKPLKSEILVNPNKFSRKLLA